MNHNNNKINHLKIIYLLMVLLFFQYIYLFLQHVNEESFVFYSIFFSTFFLLIKQKIIFFKIKILVRCISIPRTAF